MGNSQARYDRTIQTVCLLILAGISLAAALYWLRPVMIPFVMALFLAFTLSPVVDLQTRRWGIPRPVAIGLALVLGVAILAGAALLATTAVGQLTANADTYQQKFGELVNRAITGLPLERLGIDGNDLRRSLGAPVYEEPPAEPAVEGAKEPVTDGTAPAEGTASAEATEPSLLVDTRPYDGPVMGAPSSSAYPRSAASVQSFSIVSPAAVRSLLEAIAGTVLDVVSQGVLVLVFLIFLLAGDNALSGTHGGSFGESAITVRHYVATCMLLSALTGLLVGLALWMLGVEMALTFGFLAFVLNFVPNIGCIIATLLPLPVVLLSGDPSPAKVALAIGVPGAIQVILGNFIVPKVMGRSLNLHPLAVLIALIFWGMLWGIVGVLLAVPITAVIRIWLTKSPYTLPVANVMSGRSPFAQTAGARPGGVAAATVIAGRPEL